MVRFPVVLLSSVPIVLTQDRCARAADVYNEPPKKVCRKQLDETTELEKCVAKVRSEVAPIKESMKGFLANSASFLHDTVSTIGDNVDYVRGAGQEVQVGVIAGSALLASMFGFRRGLFRKLWYGTLGGVGAAAVIYPNEAKILASAGFQLTKCYSAVAYNFILGTSSDIGGKQKTSGNSPDTK